MIKSNAVIYSEEVQGVKLDVTISPLATDVIPERIGGHIDISGVSIDWAYRFDRITAGTPFRHSVYKTSIPTDAIVAELKTKVSSIALEILSDYEIDITAIEQAAMDVEDFEEIIEEVE